MMENPVSSPMVPPIADNMSTNFAALSLIILSNVGVSKDILTNLILFFHWYPDKSFVFIHIKEMKSMITFYARTGFAFKTLFVFLVWIGFLQNFVFFVCWKACYYHSIAFIHTHCSIYCNILNTTEFLRSTDTGLKNYHYVERFYIQIEF